MEDAQLRTVWLQRQADDRAGPLSQPLNSFMKGVLAKRVRQLSQLAEIWDEAVPPDVREHTALDSFNRGVLTVMVDSASHRFQLQTLLNGGLLRLIQARYSGSLTKIRLVPGQFYAVDISGSRRYEF